MKAPLSGSLVKQPSRLLIHLELLGVVTIWAGTFVSTKMILAQVPPAMSALLRYMIASVMLCAINLRNPERIQPADYGHLFGLGLTGVTFYYLFQHYGIRYTQATDAALLISLSPVFIGVISWLWLRERWKPAAAAGLFLAFGGTLLIIADGQPFWKQPGDRVWGDLLILLTAVSWAFYSVAGKKLLSKYKPLTLITYTTMIGTACLLPFALPDLPRVDWAGLTWVTWLNLLYLGGAASVYGYLAWYRGLLKLPAVTVGSYLYFRPLLTGIIAALVLGEQISWFMVGGGALIITGTYLTTK